jgi:hypothetical protein
MRENARTGFKGLALKEKPCSDLKAASFPTNKPFCYFTLYLYRADDGIVLFNKEQRQMHSVSVSRFKQDKIRCVAYPFYQTGQLSLKIVPLVQLHYKSTD